MRTCYHPGILFCYLITFKIYSDSDDNEDEASATDEELYENSESDEDIDAHYNPNRALAPSNN